MLWKNYLDDVPLRVSLCDTELTHFFEDPLYSNILGTTHLLVLPLECEAGEVSLMVALGVREATACINEIECAKRKGSDNLELLSVLLGSCEEPDTIRASVWGAMVSPDTYLPEGKLHSWIHAGKGASAFPVEHPCELFRPIRKYVNSAYLHRCVAEKESEELVGKAISQRVKHLNTGEGDIESLSVHTLLCLESFYTQLRKDYYKRGMILHYRQPASSYTEFVLARAAGFIFHALWRVGIEPLDDPHLFIGSSTEADGKYFCAAITKRTAEKQLCPLFISTTKDNVKPVIGAMQFSLSDYANLPYDHKCQVFQEGCNMLLAKMCESGSYSVDGAMAQVAIAILSAHRKVDEAD